MTKNQDPMTDSNPNVPMANNLELPGTRQPVGVEDVIVVADAESQGVEVTN